MFWRSFAFFEHDSDCFYRIGHYGIIAYTTALSSYQKKLEWFTFEFSVQYLKLSWNVSNPAFPLILPRYGSTPQETSSISPPASIYCSESSRPQRVQTPYPRTLPFPHTIIWGLRTKRVAKSTTLNKSTNCAGLGLSLEPPNPPVLLQLVQKMPRSQDMSRTRRLMRGMKLHGNLEACMGCLRLDVVRAFSETSCVGRLLWTSGILGLSRIKIPGLFLAPRDTMHLARHDARIEHQIGPVAIEQPHLWTTFTEPSSSEQPQSLCSPQHVHHERHATVQYRY